MPTMSRSRTTTPSHGDRADRPQAAPPGGGRLPAHRPPTPPGEMLAEEFLRPLGLSQSELARRLGVSYPRLNEVIRGKRAITPDTALRLERVLGMPADFWLGLQQDWDLWHARANADAAALARLEPIPLAPA
jgi:antitoxin HigA-1